MCSHPTICETHGCAAQAAVASASLETSVTDREVLDAVGTDKPFNQARRAFQEGYARIERARAQNLSPLVLRRLEFDIVRRIAGALGVDV